MRLISVPFYPSKEQQRIARITYIASLTGVITASLATLFMFAISGQSLRIAAIACTVIPGILSGWLVRRHHLRLAGWVILVPNWIILTSLVFFVDGLMGESFISSILIILMATLLLGETAGLIFLVATLAIGGLQFYLEYNGLHAASIAPADLVGSVIGQVVILIMATVVINLATSRLKQLLAESRKSEQQFRATFDSAFAYIAMLTHTGETIEVNQTWLNLNVDTTDKIVGKPFTEHTWWKDTPQNMALLKTGIERAASGKFTSFEIEIVNQFHQTITLDLSLKPIADENGRVTMLLQEGHDITVRRRDQQARERAEKRYRDLFEAAPIMYVITRNYRNQPRISDCNAAFANTVGLPKTEIINRSLADFYTTESRLMLSESGYQAALHGEFIAEERQLVTSDGQIIDTLLRAQPEQDLDGNTIGTRATFVDITRLKHIERDLVFTNHQFQKLDRVKTKFIDDISHELRTPVANIKLYNSLMQKGNSDRIKSYLGKLDTQTNRLAQIVEGIVQLSQLGIVDQPTLNTFDMNKLIDHLIDAHASTAAQKELTIEIDSHLPTLMVVGSQAQLKKLNNHLLTNAINYNKQGGTVTIKTWAEPPNALIEYIDTGIGISEDELSLVTERFYRGRDVGQLTIPGVGVGLSIVQEIALMHDGHVNLSSQLDEGTTVRVSLPILPPVMPHD